MDKKNGAHRLWAWQIFIGQILIIVGLFLNLIRATFRVRGMMWGYEVFVLGMLMLLAFICLMSFAMHKKQPMFTALYGLTLFDFIVLSALTHGVFLGGIVVAVFGVLFSLRYKLYERKHIQYTHSHETVLPPPALNETHHLASPLVSEKKSGKKKNRRRKK